jgi:methionine synthase II (cobalamin-independent)
VTSAVPAARATGVGSLPGDDPVEAARVVLGELPELPHLPELPARGQHADLAGRGAALLADLSVDLQPSGWRLVPRASRDGRRARDLLARDLDAVEEVADAVGPPPALKLQATGPWTLASLLELPRGERVLSDPGAVTDLAASLAEGLTQHLSDVARRFPATSLVLQLDEPSLPAVLRARVPDASGAGRLRAPDAQRAADVLRTVLSVAAATVVHCCAAGVPVPLLRRAGAGAVSLDVGRLTPDDDGALGEAVEAGTRLLLGVVPATDAPLGDDKQVLAPLLHLWHRIGLDAGLLADAVTLTPACGLAGATGAYAKAALAACVSAGSRLDDLD